ncbi:hypothetical protein D477_013475, partial [Arthrobacter crystallopoietes BAB-32]
MTVPPAPRDSAPFDLAAIGAGLVFAHSLDQLAVACGRVRRREPRWSRRRRARARPRWCRRW